MTEKDNKKEKVLSIIFVYFFTNILACFSYFILFLILLAFGVITYDAKTFKIFLIVNLILLIILIILYESTKIKSLIVCECNNTDATKISDRIEVIEFIKSCLFVFNFINIVGGMDDRKSLFIGLLSGTLTLICILYLMNTNDRVEDIKNKIAIVLNNKGESEEEIQKDEVDKIL